MRLSLDIIIVACLGFLAGHASADDGDSSLIDDPLRPIVEPYRRVQAAAGEVGLEFELGYTMVFQQATDVLDPSSGLLSGSYDFTGFWTLLDDQAFGVGGVGWALEGGQIITHNRDEDLSGNIGSLLGVNDDLDSESVYLSELFWTHWFDDGRLTLSAGKINQTGTLDTNAGANDETAQFLATPLVNNVAVALPDNGAGVNVHWRCHEHLSLTGGIGNSEADALETTFNNLEADALFYALELGLHVAPNDLEGNYRVLLWYTDIEARASR
jgi:carbohydrate-selective porin OprB